MRTAPLYALAMLATPALAAPPQTAEQAVRAMQEPMAQEMATGVIDQLIGIVLDTRVGPAAALADPGGDVRPTDTLRNLKRRDDPQFERHLHQDTRRVVGTVAAAAGGAMTQTAELKRTAARLEAALGPLIAALRPAGSEAHY